MSLLKKLNWFAVLDHYKRREAVHHRLLSLHDAKAVDRFAELLLGITDPMANYSAVQHGLGPQILASNPDAIQRVFDLAAKFRQLKHGRIVPGAIKAAQLSYLQIGVGSEASCMMNPEACWVANTRTIWTHLVIKHADDIAAANEELSYYRDADATSEMKYSMWTAIHAELNVAMTRVGEEGAGLATRAGVEPGALSFLWADAVADALYVMHHT